MMLAPEEEHKALQKWFMHVARPQNKDTCIPWSEAKISSRQMT